jgi:hypothetical protein
MPVSDSLVVFSVSQLGFRQASLENQQIEDRLDIYIILGAVLSPFSLCLVLLHDLMVASVEDCPIISVPIQILRRHIHRGRGNSLSLHFRLSPLKFFVHQLELGFFDELGRSQYGSSLSRDEILATAALQLVYVLGRLRTKLNIAFALKVKARVSTGTITTIQRLRHTCRSIAAAKAAARGSWLEITIGSFV